MKTILACLNSEEHAEDILAAAIPLARRDMAHLIGLHTTQAITVYPGVSMYIPDTVYASFETSQTEQSAAIKEMFENRVRAEDFVSEWRSVRAQTMTAADRMVETARTADLVILAQADAALNRADPHYVQEHVIRHAGRPVLHVPEGYRGDSIGSSVVIGWSATREATRAVYDALQVMAPNAKAAIVSVVRGDDDHDEGATQLARTLARYGIEADIVQRHAGKAEIADVLEREALERGADLIVTGAFGHSRIYDFVVGAVTLELMRSAKFPVLFSH